MPIYDIKCSVCNYVYEELVKLNQDLPACPKCSSTDVKKVIISPPSFRLYGTDFYKSNEK